MSQLNDPRVFFAAERNLLAWNRTSLALMAFGFVIERSGWLLQSVSAQPGIPPESGVSVWIGLGFIMLGAVAAGIAIHQYRTVLRTLQPVEIPEGYRIVAGVYLNALVALLGTALAGYLLYEMVVH
jgi:putative membrane protein